MMENIGPYVFVTAGFLMLFLGATSRYEQDKKRIHAFGKRHFPVLSKISLDTIEKGFAAAVVILVLKKLAYYMSVSGFMQTKSSIWWIDEKMMIYLLCFIIILILLGVGRIFFEAAKQEDEGCLRYLVLPLLVVAFFFQFLLTNVLKVEAMTRGESVIFIVSTPLLLLKILCSGKYLGIVTSLILGYFIVDRFKRFKGGFTAAKAKFLVVPGIMIMVLLAYHFYQYSGDWQEKFLTKIHSAQSEAALVDLVDAANSIKINKYKSNALRMAALAIAEKQNKKWAEKVAGTIPDTMIKNNTLTGIQGKKENK